MYWLVLLGAVLTVVALYLLPALAQPDVHRRAGAAGPVPVATPLAISVLLCALGVVALGLYPKPS